MRTKEEILKIRENGYRLSDIDIAYKQLCDNVQERLINYGKVVITAPYLSEIFRYDNV